MQPFVSIIPHPHLLTALYKMADKCLAIPKDVNVLRLATAILLSKVFHFTSPHMSHTHFLLSSKRIQTPNVTILDNCVLITIQVV